MKLTALFLCAIALRAQVPALPAAVPLPVPRMQFFDQNGRPLAGGKVCTYAAGTTTPQPTYTDSGAGTANANPVILDYAGRASIYITGLSYKIVLLTAGTDQTCSTGVTQWSQDNVTDTAAFYVQHLLAVSNSSALSFQLLGSPTGSIQRTVQAKESDWLSIEDFGAIGDGSTDNSVALQNAVNYGQTTAGTLWIPPGQFNYATTLTVGGNGRVTFQGAGYGSGVVYTGTGNAWTIHNGAAIEYRVHFRDFRIWATNPLAQYGLFFNNVQEFSVERMTIGDSGGFANAGIYGEGVAILELAENAIANNAVGILMDWTAIGNNGRVDIERNNIFNSSAAAIRLENASVANVINNYIEQTPYAILIDNNSPAGGAVVDQLNIIGNNFNGTVTGGQLLRLVSNIPADPIFVIQGVIQGNEVNSSPALPSLITSTMAGNTSPAAFVNFTVSNNLLWGAATAGITADTQFACFNLQNNSVEVLAFSTPAPEWSYTGSGNGCFTHLNQAATGYDLSGTLNIYSAIAAPITATNTGTTDGIDGVSVSARGVSGTSGSGSGVQGSSTSGAGVYGVTVGALAAGVEGSGKGGYGVYGTDSTSGYGVIGISVTGVGVFGTSTSGNGLEGSITSSANAVLGINAGTGPAGQFNSNSGAAVYATSTSGYLFEGFNAGFVFGVTNTGEVLAPIHQVTSRYSVAGTPLPTCNSAAVLTWAGVTDAQAATANTTYSGSGAIIISVECVFNGSYLWTIR